MKCLIKPTVLNFVALICGTIVVILTLTLKHVFDQMECFVNESFARVIHERLSCL